MHCFRSNRSPKKTRLVVAALFFVALASCGESGRDVAETTAASTTSTAVVTTLPTTTLPPTTTAAPTTTSTSTTLAPPTTATTPSESTVEKTVAYVETWLAKEFASSNHSEGVLGPSEMVCAMSGPIEVGGVFACSLEPNTSPDLQLDVAGIVVYVLDATGRSAWTAGTDVPDSTAGLAEALAYAGNDLTCEDLMDPESQIAIFGGVGSSKDLAYFWSLVYWSLTGQPDRMDADLNGIPCETVHDASIVSQVLEGGPVR